MDVHVKAKDGFIHGPYNMSRGDHAVMDEHLARELSHLVDVVEDDGDEKGKSEHANKLAGPGETKGDAASGEGSGAGNDPADGEAQPSSALPAAQASTKTTAKPSGAGAKPATKTAK
jgi:hypothetical protein